VVTAVFGDLNTKMLEWHYVFGKPSSYGTIKRTPEDFRVTENLGVKPDGTGEHIWLHITKRRQNSDTVAKALARYVNVAYRDVGYSGQKDFQAITQQWFSIYLPKKIDIDWGGFSLEGVVIDEINQNKRKIKRGTHQSNSFEIIVRDITDDNSELTERLSLIRQQGVPNYFGEQRFGRERRNINQAYSLLVEGKRFKDRNLKGLLYSSARSWLFNSVVSKRIEQGSWDTLYDSEPVNLNNSASVFNADDDERLNTRLLELDIHPTAPLWGKFSSDIVKEYGELHEFEVKVLEPYTDFCNGLEQAGLKYQRRPIRLSVNDFEYSFSENNLRLCFDLSKGQFATSVLRELINDIS